MGFRTQITQNQTKQTRRALGILQFAFVTEKRHRGMGFGSETGDISTPRKAGFPSIAESRKIVRAECVQGLIGSSAVFSLFRLLRKCGTRFGVLKFLHDLIVMDLGEKKALPVRRVDSCHFWEYYDFIIILILVLYGLFPSEFVRVEQRVCLYMCVLLYEFNLGSVWILGKCRRRKQKKCFID